MMLDTETIRTEVRLHEERRARLGMPVVPVPRVRRELVRREPVVAPTPIYAPLNFLSSASPWFIIDLVAAKHRAHRREIVGDDRTRRATAARCEAVRLVHDHCSGMSYSRLGRIFSRHHTSIMSLLGTIRGKASYREAA